MADPSASGKEDILAQSYRVIVAAGHVLEPVTGGLSVLADSIGPKKILWATDYPYPDGFFPGAPDLTAKRPELSEETRGKILAEGAIRFSKQGA